MKNKDKYNLAHLHIIELTETNILGINITCVEIEYNGKIVKKYACKNEAGVKKFLEWLEEEYKPPILDDVEKAYLSAVIKPFREDVECIEKVECYLSENEFIHISMKKDDDYCELPNFEKGAMYKGMKVGKAYTLEELGL